MAAIPTDKPSTSIISITPTLPQLALGNKTIQFSMFDKGTWTCYDIVYADMASYMGFSQGDTHRVFAAQNAGDKEFGRSLIQKSTGSVLAAPNDTHMRNSSTAFSKQNVGSLPASFMDSERLSVTKTRRSITYYVDDDQIVFDPAQLAALNLPAGYRLYAKYTEKVPVSNFWLLNNNSATKIYADDVFFMNSYSKIVYNPLFKANGVFFRSPYVNNGTCDLVMHVLKNSIYNEEIEEIDCIFNQYPSIMNINIAITTKTDTSITAKYIVRNTSGSFFFRLYQSNGTTVLATSPTINYPQETYTFTGLAANSNYVIKAFRVQTFGTIASEPITVRTFATFAVTVSDITTSGARLSWAALNAGESVMISSAANRLFANLITPIVVPQLPGTSVTYTLSKVSRNATPQLAIVTVTTKLEPPVVNLVNNKGGIIITFGSNGATSYNIYNNNVLLASNVTHTSYTNTTITAGTQLSLTVEAVGAGIISDKSDPLDITVTLAAPVLSIASRIDVVATLEWSPIPGASAYIIGRVTPQNVFIDESTTTDTSFTYQGVDKKFYVRAKYDSATSEPSNVITFTTSSPPTKLQGTYDASGTSLTLSWTAAIGDGYTYYIYRQTGAQTGYDYDFIDTTSATTFTIPTTIGSSATQRYLVSSLPIQYQFTQVYGLVGNSLTVIGMLGVTPHFTPAATVALQPKIAQVTVTGATVGADRVTLTWNPVSCDDSTVGVSYRIYRECNGRALPELVTSDVSSTIVYTINPNAPVIYRVRAEKNGSQSFTVGEQTLSLIIPPDYKITSVSPTTFTLPTINGTVPYNVVKHTPGGLFAEEWSKVGTGGRMLYYYILNNAGSYTFGYSVRNTILGVDTWSEEKTFSITVPEMKEDTYMSLSVSLIFQREANKKARVNYSFNQSASVAAPQPEVFMLVDGVYVPVQESEYDASNNILTIPNLEPNVPVQLSIVEVNDDGTINVNEPLTVTVPREPDAPTLELSGANVLLIGGDVDISSNTFTRTDTGATLVTKSGTVTSVAISELVAAANESHDFSLSIQVLSVNNGGAGSLSNTITIPIERSNSSLSLSSWVANKLTNEPSKAVIKSLMRENANAFSEAKVTLTSEINILQFLDTVNDTYSPPNGEIPQTTIINPKAGVPVDITDVSTGVIYINTTPGETVQLELNGVIYTIFVTETGFTYDGVAYVLGNTVQFGSAYYIIQGLGSVLIQPYTPPPVPCFLGSARVLTQAGYRRIATLRAGDRVKTADGRVVAITQVAIHEVAATAATQPYVIPQGRYGAVRDIHISPDHKILVDGAMIEAKHAPGLTRDRRQGTLTYYNLELPDPADCMVVDGVTCESLSHVRRMVVTLAEFLSMLRDQYGAQLSPHILQRIKQNCRFLNDGRVEVPMGRPQ